MSITDELRAVAAKTECANGRCEKLYRGDLDRIADRIDAEHEKAVRERRRSCVYYDPERHYCSCHDYDVSGYVELPKDSDGEYIHVGDRMEWVRYKDDDPTIVRTVSGIGNSVFFAWSDEQGRYAQYEAHAYRHYHAPIVEDVLREMLYKAHIYDKREMELLPDLIADYAKRLTLAESEDA